MKKVFGLLIGAMFSIVLIAWQTYGILSTEAIQAPENSYLEDLYTPIEVDTTHFYVREEVNNIIYDVPYEKRFQFYNQYTKDPTITHYILETAIEYNVPINLIFAIAYSESRFNPRAVNTNAVSTDYGLFQLNNSYRQWSREEFFDIRKNTVEGIRYFKEMLVLFNGDIISAIAAYNAGPGRVLQGNIPQTTEVYVSKVLHKEDELNVSFNSFLKNIK